MQICAGCERPILDRFLLNVLDRTWHTRCVQCTDCNTHLTDKCFSREGKLYCRDDFFLRFGTKCAGCLLGISPSDLVRRARNKVFHLKCFTCMMCRKELSTGEELYILDENKFICKDDYLSSKFTGSDVDDDADFDSIIENQESEKDFNADTDSIDTKRDLFLSQGDPSHLARYSDQLNGNINVQSSDGGIMPNSPLGQTLQDGKVTNNSMNSSGSSGVKDEPLDQLSDSCPSPPCSGESQPALNTGPGSPCSSLDANDNNNNKDGEATGKTGNKRRGPRTTIKAKQLEVLKASFNATPKPTRHIREQLAAETGLNMRVIQVWFQNRRSKERRMKQLSALGARRHFFRSPRRMRALRAGMSPNEIDETELMGPGYGYYNDNGQEYFPGFPGPGYGEFFPGQGPELHPGLHMPHPGRATPPMGLEHQLHPAHLGPEGQFLPHDMMPGSGSPDPNMHHEDQYMMSLPPRSLPGPPFPPQPTENW